MENQYDAERRREERRPVSFPAIVAIDNEHRPGVILNMSASGLLMRLDQTAEPGAADTLAGEAGTLEFLRDRGGVESLGVRVTRVLVNDGVCVLAFALDH